MNAIQLSKKMIEIKTDKAPQAVGPYSQAIESNGFIFVSGQVAIDYKTGLFEENNDIEKQSEMVLNNIKNILEKCKLNLDDVVKVEIFLSNIKDFKMINEIYGKYFVNNPKPARQTVEVSKLPLNAKIEISCIAKK